MNARRLFRSLPALLFAWLAALCLQVAQPGALVHQWAHAFEAPASAHAAERDHAAHALTVAHADHADHGDHTGCDEPGQVPDNLHNSLCSLCAHFAFLGGLQTGQSVMPAVSLGQYLPLASPAPTPHGRLARERYAARAPPALLI